MARKLRVPDPLQLASTPPHPRYSVLTSHRAVLPFLLHRPPLPPQGSPYYKKAVDTGASTLGWVEGLTLYKMGGKYLYPIVQPVADPALEKLSRSQAVTKLVDYWQPALAATPAAA